MNRGLLSIALLSAFAAMASAVEQEIVPREVLVKFKEAYANSGGLYHGAIGGKVIRTIPQLGIVTVKIGAGHTVKEAVTYYKNLGVVEFAEPNGYYYATALPNDPKLNQQYSPGRMNVPAAWDQTIGSPSVLIAVLDTGVDYNHEDLAGKVIKGRDYVNNDDDPMDDNEHGTHVAGIAAAQTNNGVGISGIGYNSTIYASKVLAASGGGSWDGIAAAVTGATDFGVDVINMSIGGFFKSDALETAVNYAWNKGVVIVAASGNENTDMVSYPGGFDKVIAVGATTSSDTRAGFSNFGSWVDVAGPGEGILSTIPGNGYAAFSGTSMASPNVAGVCGLLISYAGKGNVSNLEVRNALESTTKFVGTWLTHGLVDAGAAIQKIRPPVVTPVNATAVKKFEGTTTTGTVSALSGTDGLYYVVNSRLISGLGTVAGPKITFPYTLGADKYIGGKLTVRGYAAKNVTTTAYIQSNDGAWTMLKSFPMKTSTTLHTVTLPANISTYLNQNKIQIVLRAVLPTRLGNNATYGLALDQATIDFSTRQD